MTAVLYILMRTDLASMNTGKGIAQGSHASNAFVHKFHALSQEGKISEKTNKAFYEWENSTAQGFGTVIVLGGAWEKDIVPAVDKLKNVYITDKVFDPTYPLVDGSVVHLIPLESSAYVFVPNREDDWFAKNVLGGMNLHP